MQCTSMLKGLTVTQMAPKCVKGIQSGAALFSTFGVYTSEVRGSDGVNVGFLL